MTESSRQSPNRCPKCGGAMASGYMPDRNAGWYEPSKWFAGELQLDSLNGIKDSPAPPLLVITDRCEDCGFLESYARKP